MRRLLRHSLSGRLIALMLLALALSQGVSLIVYRFERAHTIRSMLKEECFGRVASILRLMEATPVAERETVLAAINTPLARHWLTTGPLESAARWQVIAREHLLRPIALADGSAVSESLFSREPGIESVSDTEWQLLASDDWLRRRPAHLLDLTAWNGFGFATQLSDGRWLNTVFAKPAVLIAATPAPGYYVTLVSTVVIFSLAAWLIARHIAQPLRHLTHAAEKLGRGEEGPLLIEEGPDDIRSTIAAFNRMQVRLRRFVEDRTQMLAAIGHDLRTPITSLRLRAEFVENADEREKILATLAEMQGMIEATLAFARSEAEAEATRAVELSSLLDSLCDDLAELGWKVSYTGDETRITCACRPDALRRALRNLIENAVRYGDAARVSARATADGAEILVEDDGPGIPAEERERVFAPFFRLESSRNGATGGVGLGLSIARTIVRSHGGDITLLDGEPRGLRVRVVLPCSANIA